MKPKISIVIPSRNRAENLKNAVKSLLNQTINKDYFEIIIVDYGGEDNSKEMLIKFRDKRIKYIYVNEKGVWNLSRARNVGIKRASGDLVVSLDADMLLERDVLERVYDDFVKREKNVLYQIPRRDIKGRKEIKLHLSGDFPGDFQATHLKNWLKVRGFDERMTGYGYEDGDLVIRMKRIGVNQHWLPPSLKIYHQYHEESAGEESYVNLIKSKLNFSYKANNKNWGSAKKQTPRLSLILWKLFDKVTIFLVVRPTKRFKRFLRRIKNK